MPDDVVVWQLPRIGRVFAVATTVPLTVWMLVEVALHVTRPWAFLVLALLFASLGSSVLRRCRLDHTTITARGRTGTTRVVDLADVRQVGQGFGALWVQTHRPLDERGNDVLALRMIGPSSFTGLPVRDKAVDMIRERAERAGAQLDPPAPNPTRPPSAKPLIFSI